MMTMRRRRRKGEKVEGERGKGDGKGERAGYGKRGRGMRRDNESFLRNTRVRTHARTHACTPRVPRASYAPAAWVYVDLLGSERSSV